MTIRVARALIGAIALAIVGGGCSQDNDPTNTPTTSTCVVATGLMGTGSQPIVGTKTVTAIFDGSGNSITSDPSKRVVVGQPAPGINGWQLAGAVTGPNSGSCTAPITITTEIGENAGSVVGPVAYTIDATAVWPATVSK